MKKIVNLIIPCVLAFVLMGCSSGSGSNNPSGNTGNSNRNSSSGNSSGNPNSGNSTPPSSNTPSKNANGAQGFGFPEVINALKGANIVSGEPKEADISSVSYAKKGMLFESDNILILYFNGLENMDELIKIYEKNEVSYKGKPYKMAGWGEYVLVFLDNKINEAAVKAIRSL